MVSSLAKLQLALNGLSIKVRHTIAKNQNTFAKRTREVEKRRKADDKRQDREKRKAIALLPPSERPVPVLRPPEDDEDDED